MVRVRSIRSYVLATAVLAAMGMGGAVVSADIITLSDGSKVTGTMTRKGDAMIINKIDGTQITVQATEIAQVTLTSNITPAERADNAWKQLQTPLNRTAKLDDAIAMLEKFERDNHATPAADKAANVIVSYKQLATQSPVKFRGVWVAKAQVEVLTRAEADTAKPIIATYKGGKMKEALEQAKEALKTSPQNPHVLAVAGLASYRLNQLPLSREYFTKVTEVNDTSVMALNNLAVVSFQLNKALEGLGFYTRALQAAPENRLLLDNIVEALSASDAMKAALAFTALQRQFLQAETNMQARQAKEGYFRYGSTWVTQQQHDRLAANKTAIKASLDTIEKQYNEAVRTLNNVDSRIGQAKADVDTAANDYNYWVTQTAFTPYYDANAAVRRDIALGDLERARRRLATLQDQRGAAQDVVQKVKTDEAKIKTSMAELDRDQMSGVQRIMDLGDDETVPAPTAIPIPPVVEKPAPAPVAPVVITDIPQQQSSLVGRGLDRQPSSIGYGQQIQYGTYGSVVPPLIIGNTGGLPVFVKQQPVTVIGGGVVGGQIQPVFPVNGPGINLGSPGLPMFTPAGSGR